MCYARIWRGQRCWIYSVEKIIVCYPSCALLVHSDKKSEKFTIERGQTRSHHGHCTQGVTRVNNQSRVWNSTRLGMAGITSSSLSSVSTIIHRYFNSVDTSTAVPKRSVWDFTLKLLPLPYASQSSVLKQQQQGETRPSVRQEEAKLALQTAMPNFKSEVQRFQPLADRSKWFMKRSRMLVPTVLARVCTIVLPLFLSV